MIQETIPTGAAAFLSGAKGSNRMDNIAPIPPAFLRRVQVREFDGYLVRCHLQTPFDCCISLRLLT
jgi:hypothetical protein